MKGLLLKDFTLLFKVCKSFLIIMVVFFVIIPFSDSYSFLNYYLIILSAMIPFTLIAYDEKEKWDVYVKTLPVTNSDYVSAKYLTGIISNVVVLVILVLLRSAFYSNTNDLIAYASFLLIIGTVFMSINLPIVFKFGSAKGRIVNFVLIAVICVFILLAAKFSTSSLGLVLNVISGKYNVPLYLGVIGALLLLAVSWLTSIAVYNKKEK